MGLKNKNEKANNIAEFVYENYGVFLNVTELAEILKVSRFVIDRLLKIGQLPAIKLGGQYRVRTDDLLNWWDEQVKQEQKEVLKKLLK